MTEELIENNETIGQIENQQQDPDSDGFTDLESLYKDEFSFNESAKRQPESEDAQLLLENPSISDQGSFIGENMATSDLEDEGIASIIDPEMMVEGDAIEPPLDGPDHFIDQIYQKQRPILLFQLIFIWVLIFCKYGTYFTNIKFKGFQMKLFGSLLITQCIMLHQKTNYELIWQNYDIKSFIDAVVVAILFFISILHMARLTHLIPNSWRGQYQLMAQRVMEKNEQELQLTNANTDIIYENVVCSRSPQDSELSELLQFQEDDNDVTDYIFTFFDIVIQISVAIILQLNFLTKEGVISTLAPDSVIYLGMKRYGLTKTISLIAFFAMSHVNQSRYVGLSKLDSAQYFLIRALLISIPFLIIARADYSGSIRNHFEQLLVAVFYLAYFAFIDWHNSRKNQLALFFDEMLADGLDPTDASDQNNYAERNQYRVVLIMFRPDGRGGIQGIIMDSFYIDSDGNIANEFYLVSDATNGEIKKIEDTSVRQIQDSTVIQKAFYQYFLMDKKRDDEQITEMKYTEIQKQETKASSEAAKDKTTSDVSAAAAEKEQAENAANAQR